MHRQAILDLIAEYEQSHPSESITSTRIADFVRGHDNCFSREQLSGHLTGSAWVVNQDGSKALLTHHKKLNIWVQLGGHADGDSKLERVAMREAEEESGIAELKFLQQEIFDIDIHEIPARGDEPAHYHYDCRFLLQAATEEFTVSEESHALAWIPFAEIGKLTSEMSVLRMVSKFQQRLS